MTLRCGFHDEKRTRCARPDSHVGECIFLESIKSNQPCPAAADQGNHTIYIGDTVCYMPEVGNRPGFAPDDCVSVVTNIEPPPDDTYDWPEYPKIFTAKHGWKPARLFSVVAETLRPSISPDATKLSLAAMRHENASLAQHNSTLIKQVATLLEQKVDTELVIQGLQAEQRDFEAEKQRANALEFALADLRHENGDLDASLNRLLTEKLQLQQSLDREKAANEALQAEIDAFLSDLRSASGELLLELPLPHSPMAQVVTANRLLKQRNAQLSADIAELREDNTRTGANNVALTHENNRIRAENSRILAGNFTSEEFQNFCHNLSQKPHLCEQFCDGCDAYQKQLFGSCRSDDYKEQITELTSERDKLIAQLEDANYWRERHCKEAEARGDQMQDQFDELQRYKRIVGEQQFEIRELQHRLRQLTEIASRYVHGKFPDNPPPPPPSTT